MITLDSDKVKLFSFNGKHEIEPASTAGCLGHIERELSRALLSDDPVSLGDLFVDVDPDSALVAFVGLADALSKMKELPEQYVSAKDQAMIAGVVDKLRGHEEI